MRPETLKIDDVEYVRKDSIQYPTVDSDGLEYCIIRTYSAGVFAGYVKSKVLKDGNFHIVLINSRRLWKWVGASLSQVAMEGFVNYDEVKIPMTELYKELPGCIEITPCTEKSRLSIEGSPVWKR